METYVTIKEYCDKIEMNDKIVIDYIFNSQSAKVKPSAYICEAFNRYSDLSVTETSQKVLKNIQEFKVEKFTKKVDNEIYNYKFNDDFMKERLFLKYEKVNDTIIYIMNLLNNMTKCKTNDILYLTAKRFNVKERTIHKRIKDYQKSVGNTLPLTSFLYHLKWSVIRQHCS